jgi:hypothetical protein
MNRQMHEFVFRGVMAHAMIRDLESDGTLRHRDAPDVEREHVDALASVSRPIRARARHMQRAYYVLHVFENVVREFIDNTFSESEGTTEWFEIKATSGMKRKLESRQKSEESNSWHAGRNKSPLFYMDFGDLSDLINNHWDLYKDLLPNQAWVTSRIGDAERSRNVIAHTNVLDDEEITRLEQHLKDWVRQLG